MKKLKGYPTITDVLGLVLLLALLQGIFGFAFKWIPNQGVVFILGALLSFGIIVYTGWRRTKKPFLKVFPLKPTPLIIYIPIFFIFFGLNIIVSEVDNITRWFFPVPDFLKGLMELYLSSGFLLYFIIGVIAPLTEEYLFRGLVINGFRENYSKTTTIIVSALIFSLMHLNPYQLFAAFTTGVLLAWIVLKTNSLVPCIIIHSFFNLLNDIVGTTFNIKIGGYTAEPLVGLVEFQPLWFDIMGIVLFIGGLFSLIYLFRKLEREGRLNVYSTN
ncbi:CPBP family intramembrane metalloprotease [Candidatus Dependentiae bacterium]|nr:CPBP family intramembrane metalloprotease [Candidatus Dependentiae bacterium]